MRMVTLFITRVTKSHDPLSTCSFCFVRRILVVIMMMVMMMMKIEFMVL